MTTHLRIPRERPFAPGRLEARRAHLLTEIRRVPLEHRRRLALPGRSHRVLAFGLAASVASAVIAFGMFRELAPDGPGPNETIRVVVAPAGAVPAWNGIVLTGPCLGLSFVNGGCAIDRSPGVFTLDVPRAVGNRAGDGVEIVGGVPAERRALREILGRMPGSSVSRVEILPQTAADGGGVTLRFSASGGDALRADWEEMLLAGAYRDVARERGLRPLVGFPPPSPVAPPRAETRTEVQARVRAAAAAAGARVDELRIYEPNGVAVLVVLRAPSPGRFLRQELPAVLEAFGDRWREYDGTFVEILDEQGVFVWAAGTAPRTSHGSVGTRAGLEGCSPVASWGPTPPPCPVE